MRNRVGWRALRNTPEPHNAFGVIAPKTGCAGRRNLQETIMPYLFWAVVPFEIMRLWWVTCELERDKIP
jgi:hypothetical protein